MKELITYEINELDGRQWETTKEKDAKKALLKGCMVFENKRIISHKGITFTRIVTITEMSLDHFKERIF